MSSQFHLPAKDSTSAAQSEAVGATTSGNKSSVGQMEAIFREEGLAPRPSPETDPTNPAHQEALLGWPTLSEWANERRLDEPGLTDEDRSRRGY